jgi:VWFA-related protein
MVWHPSSSTRVPAHLAALCLLFPALPQAQQQDLTIQCIVRDDHHRPVQDLKPEDLQITEDGKPVALKSLKPGTAQPAQLSILLDSSSNESLTLTREAAPDLLSALNAAQLALWDVNPLALLRDFNTDRNTVTGLIVSGAPAPAPAKDTEISPQSKAILTTAHRLVDEEKNPPALALLSALIEHQGNAPGRKEIVYFAPNGEDSALTEAQIAALASNALRAGVSVYIIEAAGTSAQVEAKAAALLAPQHSAKKEHPAAAAKQNIWRELARRTGGAYALSGKDSVRNAAHRAAEDLNSYFQATYTPTPQTEDGHFRPVVIKVTRPHTTSQNAAGYFSVPIADAYSVASYEPPLLQSLHETADTDQLRFDIGILRFSQHDGKTRTALIVEVPRSSLTTLDDEAQKLRKVHFAVYALLRSADGKVVCRFNQDLPYETAFEHAGVSPKNLFTFQRQAWLPPGDYQAEVAVGDQNSANVGKRTLSFSIAKTSSPLTLADVIVVRGVEPRASAKAEDDPLNLGAQSLVPWTASTVHGHKGGELPVLLKIFADPAADVLPDVQFEIHRGKDLVANLPLLVSGGTGGQFQALVWLPEDSLEAGHYTLLARATQGQATSEQRIEFDYALSGLSGELQEADTEPDLAPKQLLSAGPDLISGAKRPSDQEINTILQAARARALDYKKSLPNFTCLKTNKRLTSKTGIQNWKTKDSITEMLRYSQGKEEHQILELNGVTKGIDPSQVKGLLIKGEFGEFLDAVFSSDAHAEFTWQGRTLVDGQEAHVFAFKVKRANSIYSMSTVDGRSRVVSAFHGIIHIDANTLVTRFVSIEAEDIPAQALYRESVASVSYGYFTIEGQKCLLPKTALLSVRIGKRFLSKDEMQFRNYRRFGATSTLITR